MTTTNARLIAAILPARIDSEGVSRLIVLHDDGRTLLGLVSMDADRSHFCVATRPQALQSSPSQ